MSDFFQRGKYDEYFVLNVKSVDYSITCVNLRNEAFPKELVAKWIGNAVEKMQVKAVTGILRVIDPTRQGISAIYCLIPAQVQEPAKIAGIIQAIMCDARAKAALERDGHKFVIWNESH
jgi:hypothetical protein